MTPISALYVDDEPDLLELTRMYLGEGKGISLDTCISAIEAQALLATRKYDVIISDYQMPEMDGIEFLKFVREHYGRLPFILFTGRGREQVVMQALENGADFYIQKGGDPRAQFAELQNRIEKSVAEFRAVASQKDTERRIADIISFLPDATFAIDNDGIVLSWNRAIEEMTGIPADRMIGRGNYEYALPFYGERRAILIDLIFSTPGEIRKHYSGIVQTGTMLAAETNLPLLNGTPRVLWGKASPLYDRQGKITGAIEVIRDITDRKETENALRESEEKFREMADMLPQMVYEADTRGVLTYANAIAFDLFGYTREEFSRGLRVIDMIVPEEREPAVRVFREILNGNPMDPDGREYHVMRRDGSRFPVTIYTAPILRGGNVTGIRGIVVDISGRTAVEEALRERERVLQTLIGNLPGFVYRCKNDQNWTMVYISRGCRDLTGYAPEEFLENRTVSFNTIVHPDHRERIWTEWQDTLAKKGIFEGEYPVVTKSGETRWVWERGLGIYSDDGRLLFLEGFITDVTERRKAGEALEQIRNELERRVQERTGELVAAIDDLHKEIAGRERLMEVLRRNEEQLKLKLDSVLSPDVKVENEDLANIIDCGALQSMMEDLSHLTGIAMAILDVHGNVIGATGWQEICTKYHRKNEASSRYCTESDLYLANNVKQGEFVAYRCRNTLWDVVTPLYIGGKHLGNIYTGQFFYDDEIIDETIFAGQAAEFGFDREEYLAALRRVPRVSRETIQYLMTYMVKFTGFVSRLSYSNLKLARALADVERADRELRESGERYRTLFENSGNALMVVDEDATILQVNREFENVSGYANGEIIGRLSLTTFIADETDRGRVMNYHRLRRSTPDAAPASYEIRVADRGGKMLDMIISVVLIPGTRQSLIALTDITRRKQAEQELRILYVELEERVADRTRELTLAREAYRIANTKLNLLNNITRHEMRNQLTALQGFLALSKTRITDPERLGELIEKEERIASILERQISFTRYYQDMGVKEPSWQNVGSCVRKEASLLALDTHHGVILQVDRSDLEICADPLLEKVFYNLLDNAIRYGGEQMKTIRVSSEETENELVLSCEDDGAGISNGDREHLFERGFGKNTGLGLFLAREILGITGITIRETGISGKGARFEMLVPRGMYRFSPG